MGSAFTYIFYKVFRVAWHPHLANPFTIVIEVVLVEWREDKHEKQKKAFSFLLHKYKEIKFKKDLKLEFAHSIYKIYTPCIKITLEII